MNIYCLFEFNRIINLNGFHEHSITIFLNSNEYYMRIGCMNFASLDELKKEMDTRNIEEENKLKILESIIIEALK